MESRQTGASVNSAATLEPAKARLGLIIPSVNVLSEPQFRYFAPACLGIHVARLRLTGRWACSLAGLQDKILEAAAMLADANCDVIAFHCTASAMQDGPEAEAHIIERIAAETGAYTFGTGEAVVGAFRELSIQRAILVTPYTQEVHDLEAAYLKKLGFEIIYEIALALGGGENYINYGSDEWVNVAVESWREGADGIFLSCTNTRQIEAIEPLETQVGHPCVTSNQAVLWTACRHLASRLGGMPRAPALGRLFNR